MTAAGQPGLRNETFGDRAFRVTAEAYVGSTADWAQSVQLALHELLECLATSPERTRACVNATLEGGTLALEQRDRTLERFVELLRPRYGDGGAVGPPPVVAEAIAGGIYDLIRRYVAEDRVQALPDALPTATVLALTPFVGDAEAGRLATRPIRLQ